MHRGARGRGAFKTILQGFLFAVGTLDAWNVDGVDPSIAIGADVVPDDVAANYHRVGGEAANPT